MTKATDQVKARATTGSANGRPGRAEREAESRVAIKARFLDAAERLLIDEGYAAITTRRVAAEAGANHGLVHYYFGSMDELLARVLERFTERLVERQRAMYSADVPFLEKWKTAWRFQEEDLAAGYPKIWLELQAASWNRPDLRERVVRVDAEWRAVLTEAFSNAARGYGLDRRQFPVEALVSLMMTFGQGYVLERLVGIDDGHRALLAWIDKWLKNLEREAK